MIARPWRVALVTGGFAAGVGLAPHGIAAELAAGAAACAAATLVGQSGRLLLTAGCLLALALGTWRGSTAAVAGHSASAVAGHLGLSPVVIRGSVGAASVPGRETAVVVDATALADGTGVWALTGGVVALPVNPVDVLPGDLVEISAPGLRAPPNRPGALSADSLERVGVQAVASAAQVTKLSDGGISVPRWAAQVRRALVTGVDRTLPEPESTLLLGIAFGVHGRLSAVVRDPLQEAGLIHVVAVSGLKVVMVVGLVEALARTRAWPRRRRTVISLAVMSGYVVLSGAGAAALRSSLMVGSGLLLRRDGRQPHSFALLGLCAAAMLALQPALAGDVGFQLSFLGTAGILVLASPLADRLPGPRMLVEPFAVTIAAQLATAPVTAGTFGVLSLVGPIANAAILPLLPLLIVLGAAGSMIAVLDPGLGWLPLQLAGLGTKLVVAVADGAAALPFAALHVTLWPTQWMVAELAAITAGAVGWRLAAQRCVGMRTPLVVGGVAASVAAGLSVTVAAATTVSTLTVTVLDVGSGVAVLIRPPGGGTILVDGGADPATLTTALDRALSPLDRRIDAVVLTSADHATAGALPGLFAQLQVGTLIVSQPLPAALQAAAATLVEQGTRVAEVGASAWTLGGLTARCVPAVPGPAAPCALQLSDGSANALITGNLTAPVQEELASSASSALRTQLMVGPSTAALDHALISAAGARFLAVPAKRSPPGLSAPGAEIAITGRDGDLDYVGAGPDGLQRAGP